MTYLTKDGRVMLYAGRDVNGNFLFYILTTVPIIKGSYGFDLKIGNFDNVHHLVCELAKRCMETQADANCLLVMKTLPNIIGVYPDIDLRRCYMDWWVRNGLPQIRKEKGLSNTERKEMQERSRAAGRLRRSVVNGKVYLLDTGGYIIYLGKNTNNKHVVFYIHDIQSFYNSPYDFFCYCVSQNLPHFVHMSTTYPSVVEEASQFNGFKFDTTKLPQAIRQLLMQEPFLIS